MTYAFCLYRGKDIKNNRFALSLQLIKKIYNDLKNIIKRYSSNTVNGYIILKNAYNEKEQLRFVTISVQSPKEYDLKV